MAPKIDVFESSIRILKLSGIVDPSSQTSHRLFLAWNLILILCGFEFVVDVFLGTILTNKNFNVTLENLTLVVSGLSFSCTHFLFSWKKREIFALIRRVNGILEQVENDVSTVETARWKRICEIIYHVFSYGVIGQIAVYYLFTLIKYCFLGVKDASPFEIYFPFDKEGRIVEVILFQFVTFVHPILSVILGKTVFGSFTVAIRGILEAIERRFKRIKPERTREYLVETIRWHSETIQVMREYNSLFRAAFLMEYLLSMIYISTSGFLMIRVQSYADTERYRYTGMYLSYLTHPLFTCICGHLIWNQNEKLFASIYNNDWYRLPPDTRRLMVLPTLLSGKGLTINYRNHVHFNLSLYLHIVRQSYSFLTFIKMNSTG